MNTAAETVDEWDDWQQFDVRSFRDKR